MDNDGKLRKIRHRENSRQPRDANSLKNSGNGDTWNRTRESSNHKSSIKTIYLLPPMYYQAFFELRRQKLLIHLLDEGGLTRGLFSPGAYQVSLLVF